MMRHKQSIALEMVVLEQGTVHLIVQMCVKELEPLWWILDTGASRSVIDSALAEQCIDHDSEGVMATGLGKEMVETRSGMLTDFRMGDTAFEPLEVAIVDLRHINAEYANYSDKVISGLLGSDFFLRERASIDFEAITLTL